MIWLARLGQYSNTRLRSLEDNIAGRSREPHRLNALAPRVPWLVVPCHRKTQLHTQPCRQQACGGGVSCTTDLNGGDLLVRWLIEHGCKLLTPVREARPGEVSVTRRVGRAKIGDTVDVVGPR